MVVSMVSTASSISRVSKKIALTKNKQHGIEISADIFNVANLSSSRKAKELYKTLGTQALFNSKGFDGANVNAIIMV